MLRSKWNFYLGLECGPTQSYLLYFVYHWVIISIILYLQMSNHCHYTSPLTEQLLALYCTPYCVCIVIILQLSLSAYSIIIALYLISNWVIIIRWCKEPRGNLCNLALGYECDYVLCHVIQGEVITGDFYLMWIQTHNIYRGPASNVSFSLVCYLINPHSRISIIFIVF